MWFVSSSVTVLLWLFLVRVCPILDFSNKYNDVPWCSNRLNKSDDWGWRTGSRARVDRSASNISARDDWDHATQQWPLFLFLPSPPAAEQCMYSYTDVASPCQYKSLRYFPLTCSRAANRRWKHQEKRKKKKRKENDLIYIEQGKKPCAGLIDTEWHEVEGVEGASETSARHAVHCFLSDPTCSAPLFFRIFRTCIAGRAPLPDRYIRVESICPRRTHGSYNIENTRKAGMFLSGRLGAEETKR